MEWNLFQNWKNVLAHARDLIDIFPKFDSSHKVPKKKELKEVLPKLCIFPRNSIMYWEIYSSLDFLASYSVTCHKSSNLLLKRLGKKNAFRYNNKMRTPHPYPRRSTLISKSHL